MVGGAVAHPAATSACPGVLCQETGYETLRLRSGQAAWIDAAAVASPPLFLVPHALHQSLIVGQFLAKSNQKEKRS